MTWIIRYRTSTSEKWKRFEGSKDKVKRLVSKLIEENKSLRIIVKQRDDKNVSSKK